MAFLGARMLLTTALTGQLQVTTTSVLPALLNIIIMNLYLSIESLIINHLPASYLACCIHLNSNCHTLCCLQWMWLREGGLKRKGERWRVLERAVRCYLRIRPAARLLIFEGFGSVATVQKSDCSFQCSSLSTS